MMFASKLLSGGVEGKTYSDDVFQIYTRTGTGASQTITTGIAADLVISKGRSGATDWAWYDKVRGVTKDLVSNSTAAETTQAQGLTSFSSTGHTWGTLVKINTNSATYVDVALKKAPKFFDVVTYTGDGSTSLRSIPHSLGCIPGLVIVKCTSGTANWKTTKMTDIGVGDSTLHLNTTEAANQLSTLANGYVWGASSSTFIVTAFSSSVSEINANGATYVAYLFAHDTSADGIIQCGSFTHTAGAVTTVSLGFEPQFLITKNATTAGNWSLTDSARGLYADATSNILKANASDAETVTSNTNINANGFSFASGNSSGTYIYLAIRRPNKPPTSGTQVFNPTVYTGTNADNRLINTGIPTDMVWLRQRNGSGAGYEGFLVGDRLRGNAFLKTSSTAAEATVADGLDAQLVSGTEYGNAFSSMSGVWVGNNSGAAVGNANINANTTANNHVALAFKRAPGFFDVVCYTGTGVARTVAHSLGVVPELMIVKSRSNAAESWAVYAVSEGATKVGFINVASAFSASSQYWNDTNPTDSSFTVGINSVVNDASTQYIAYLFATKVGVSSCFSYTGNGTNQNIECSFSSGARFVLLRRTDVGSNWLVADTARGIVSGNDPLLTPTSTAAEVTTIDWIDPYSGGFNIVQEGTNNANVNGATYTGLAIA